jgi:LPXTG-motif cell wall-anchored protein
MKNFLQTRNLVARKERANARPPVSKPIVVPKLDLGEKAMKSKKGWIYMRLALIAGAVCLASTLNVNAQVDTKTTTTSQAPSVTTQTENGVVVTVSGNDLVVKMADGTIRHFENVPEDAKVTVDGKELGIHDLKPGMKLERTITTTTTPKTIKTVQSVTGTVWSVTPPDSVILSLQGGGNQQFKIPKNQKFNVDGQMVDAFGLKKGMIVTATKVVEVPTTQIAESKTVTGEMPPPPPAPPADVPVLVAQESTAAPTEVAQAAPDKLPQTASPLPLIGLLGLMSLASSLGVFRKKR